MKSKEAMEIINIAKTVVKRVPAADVVPVRHGRWDGDADGYYNGELVYDHWFCSECDWDDGGSLEEKPNYNYCPNCDAKME